MFTKRYIFQTKVNEVLICKIICFKSIIYIVLALKLCIKTGLIDMDTIKVLITNQKGGVGKSTISANLAAYLAIQESKKVSLIDFDKQSSASRWASKAPNIGLEIHQANLEYKNSGLTLLDARAMLRNFSLNADICIADLTWTHAIPYEFLLDFDIILVPSSTAKFEMASTEIFILEYAQLYLSKFSNNKQLILVAPSRVDKTFSPATSFTNLEFLNNCLISLNITIMKKIVLIFIYLFSNYLFSQENEVGIYFSDKEKNIDKINLIIINYEDNTKQIFEIQNSTIKREVLDFKKYDILLSTKNHIIRLPKVNFISQVSYIEIKHLNKENVNIDKELSSKKANYSINFNLGDIYYISYTKKQIRKLKNLINKT